MEDGVTSEKLECSYYLYNLLAYLGFVAAAALGFSGFQVSQWKQNLTLDGL
jgi:hypothetical protein